jgi:AcrR family transcriptional regulator
MNVQSEKRRGPGRPTDGDKRRRILDAALRVFAERGYHGTSVPDVAKAAEVATGTLYHYFASKEQLVNEVFRDAKLRLRAALLEPTPIDYRFDLAEKWFRGIWKQLAEFARSEPDAFRFLEMQDHTPYLDAESRAIEMSVLAPLAATGERLRASSGGPPVDVAIALLWGAFVGLVKAERLQYLQLDEDKLQQAATACWRMIAPKG